MAFEKLDKYGTISVCSIIAIQSCVLDLHCVYFLLYCIVNKIQIIIKNPHYFTLLTLFLTCLSHILLMAHYGRPFDSQV